MRKSNLFATFFFSAILLASCGSEGEKKSYVCSVEVNGGGGISKGLERFSYIPEKKIVQKETLIEGKQIPVDLPVSIEGDRLKFKTRELRDPIEYSLNLKSMELYFSTMVRDTPDGDLALTGFGTCKVE